jgi:pyruvate/2-oxoacid:ferredoxin oxidoreductase beta subunit
MTANPNRLNHRPDCQRPPVQISLVTEGTNKHFCPGCGKYAYLEVIAKSVIPPTPTGYRCREHPGEPVTWKGTGCPRCPTRTANKRKASQPSDDNEMETYR